MPKFIAAIFIVFLLPSIAISSGVECKICDDAVNIIKKNTIEIDRCIKDGGKESLQKALVLLKESRESVSQVSILIKPVSRFSDPQSIYQSKAASAAIEFFAPVVAGDMIHVAESFVATKSKENVEIAKSIYRDIIITFTGPVYKSFVKKAEFALDDIKDMTFTSTQNSKKKKQ